MVVSVVHAKGAGTPRRGLGDTKRARAGPVVLKPAAAATGSDAITLGQRDGMMSLDQRGSAEAGGQGISIVGSVRRDDRGIRSQPGTRWA